MPQLQTALEEVLRHAVSQALGPDHAHTDPQVRATKNPAFGDFQANLAMSLAKTLGRRPRDLAEAITAAIALGPVVAHAEVAGPGFINLRIADAFVVERLCEMAKSDRLGVPTTPRPDRVVVDYSSPNLAKEMHIGHLRSTIIGDAIVRVLRFLGHEVIAQNHLGDWGTQFGLLLEHLVDMPRPAEGASRTIGDLNELYRAAKERFDADDGFRERARRRVVALQSGEPQALALWRDLIEASLAHASDVYTRLGVLLTRDDVRGESFYNDRLPTVVHDLTASGDLVESEGAKVVFPDGFRTAEGTPLPLIVQKTDGGFGYATTDLAAARFRIDELHATRLVYVVDARQSDHFAMVFWTLRKAGFAAPSIALEHVAFGTVLGADKKPFKTREGQVVRLVEVLDEAVSRARRELVEKRPEIPVDEADAIAAMVGIGALKYADLSNDRVKDYVFDWDRMLALDGNTAPYLQNAFVRIASIFRKGQLDRAACETAPIVLTDPEERALALRLLELPVVVESVGRSLEPHTLCSYLYALATGFHRFYEACSVLGADEPIRSSRLALCAVVARTLEEGLAWLGISVPSRM